MSCAIPAGTLHGLALKSDGTVVAWGYDSAGQVDVPAGLTNVVAISAGGAHSLALQCAPTNQAPVAADDSYSVNQDAVLTVPPHPACSPTTPTPTATR